MKIGILVHSETGNTLSVAKKMEQALTNAGHTCTLHVILALGETAASKGQVPLPVRFDHPPQAAAYDAVIIGAPVWGFSLSKVMSAYMRQLPGLSGKKVGCFVTQRLSRPIFGGNHALRQLKGALKSKGAVVFASGIVNWTNAGREDQINRLIKAFSRIS